MKVKFVVIILVASLIIVLITPLVIPTVVDTQDDMANLKFGNPIYFIEQQSIKGPPKELLPYWTTLESPWETPTRFLVVNFLASYCIIVGILMGFCYVVINRRIKS